MQNKDNKMNMRKEIKPGDNAKRGYEEVIGKGALTSSSRLDMFPTSIIRAANLFSKGS